MAAYQQFEEGQQKTVENLVNSSDSLMNKLDNVFNELKQHNDTENQANSDLRDQLNKLAKDITVAQKTANENSERSRLSIGSVFNAIFHPGDEEYASKHHSKENTPSRSKRASTSNTQQIREEESELKRNTISDTLVQAVGTAHGIDSDNSENDNEDDNNGNFNEIGPNIDGMAAMITNKINKDRKLTSQLINMMEEQLNNINNQLTENTEKTTLEQQKQSDIIQSTIVSHGDDMKQLQERMKEAVNARLTSIEDNIMKYRDDTKAELDRKQQERDAQQLQKMEEIQKKAMEPVEALYNTFVAESQALYNSVVGQPLSISSSQAKSSSSLSKQQVNDTPISVAGANASDSDESAQSVRLDRLDEDEINYVNENDNNRIDITTEMKDIGDGTPSLAEMTESIGQQFIKDRKVAMELVSSLESQLLKQDNNNLELQQRLKELNEELTTIKV